MEPPDVKAELLAELRGDGLPTHGSVEELTARLAEHGHGWTEPAVKAEVKVEVKAVEAVDGECQPGAAGGSSQPGVEYSRHNVMASDPADAQHGDPDGVPKLPAASKKRQVPPRGGFTARRT